MKKIMIILLTIFLVSGCASTQMNKKYYQLTSDFDLSNVQPVDKIQKTLFIEPVKVASFLNTNSIIYQTNQIEFSAANNNLWMTNLTDQLEQRLFKDLSVLLPEYFVTNSVTNQPTATVKLMIDGFHGSYTGDAIIQGRWVVKLKNKTEVKNFETKVRLNQDGYPALVLALSKGFQEEEVNLIRSLPF